MSTTASRSARHTVEKIGGTSMNDYAAVRDNIVLRPADPGTLFNRIFVVSAYGGVTDRLLEHKRTGQPGVYALFASGADEAAWRDALDELVGALHGINEGLFGAGALLEEANAFVDERLEEARHCLDDLQNLCRHGHFALDAHLATVREMLASIGEAHSAWNTAKLLERDGVAARFVDLTAWRSLSHVSLDDRIRHAFADIDFSTCLPVATGYAHSEHGLMSSFDRGYSEMTFSRLAVITGAREAVIHKEFHLSSADPRVVGESRAVPIGRTNYDVAEQLANLGMEAIHPKAAQGLRRSGIALRVKNTFEPEHAGTLITSDYVSEHPRVEIIAGCKGIYAVEVFDPDMAGRFHDYDRTIVGLIERFKAHVVSKDVNANTITHYLSTNLKTVRRIEDALRETYPRAELNQQKVAVVSAIGSDMAVPGFLSQAVSAIADEGINVLAVHQCMRQVDMQFVVSEAEYEVAIRALHRRLVEVRDADRGMRLASPTR
ncbi:MAG: aspartate kinase [Gammaproteobacteria bacterium]